jgi:hypothetical protein
MQEEQDGATCDAESRMDERIETIGRQQLFSLTGVEKR